jgi:hypothetical protein
MKNQTPTEDTKILVLHETRWQSILNDVFTFGCIAALAYLNHTYFGGSWVLDAFSVYAACTMALKFGSGISQYCTIEELRQWARQ